jgi:hypothetical protein
MPKKETKKRKSKPKKRTRKLAVVAGGSFDARHPNANPAYMPNGVSAPAHYSNVWHTVSNDAAYAGQVIQEGLAEGNHFSVESATYLANVIEPQYRNGGNSEPR